MPRGLRHYAPATPVLVLAFLVVLMSLPSLPNHFFSLTRAKASIETTFTVNSIGDGADSNLADGVCNDGTGACTLRAAIQEANTAVTDDAITFSATLNGSIITLNSALPDIQGNLNITGPGASLITVQRNIAVGTPRFRIFTTAGSAVSVSGLTISNGHTADGTAAGNGDHGGAIFNVFGSTLNLTNVVISGNVTGNGDTNGGLGGYGGGIFNNGTVTLSNSSVTGNRTGNGPAPAGVGGAGGGIYNIGTLTITNSSISDNLTGNGLNGSGGGGGISSGGVLTITGSTISGNQTGSSGASGGGGIWAANTLTLANSTISGNQANAYGGGLAIFGGTTLTNVTITNNRGGNFGGGLYRNSDTVTLQSTVVAGNFQGASPSTTADDISGMVDANSSFNLIGTGGSGGLANGINNNQVGVADPRLGPLANNGGPTLTHTLLSGSVAIDAGNSSLTTDQRGQPRPIDDQTVVNAVGGNASDIGSYEAHSLEVNSTADADDGLCRPLGTGNGCTLREAINAANAEFGAELITVAPALTSGGPATITLSSALPDLLSDMAISGPGASLLTVGRSTAGGTPTFRIFTVNSGRHARISGVTITNGRTADGAPDGGFAPGYGGQGGNGGGILNSGVLTLTDVIVTGNRTGNGGTGSSGTGGFGGFGGGIYSSGTFTMSNVTVSNNTTGNGAVGANGGEGGSGGGIYTFFSSGDLTNCIISGNTTGRGADGTGASLIGASGGHGAGSYFYSGTVTMRTVVVSNNTTGGADVNPGHFSDGGVGAGVLINSGNVTLIDSTITGNHTGDGSGPSGRGGGGAGLVNGFATVAVLNSTISGNTTGNGNGGGGSSGGFSNSGSAMLTNTTISGNSASGTGSRGGGVLNSGDLLTLSNCTITGNFANDGNGMYASDFYPAPNLKNTIVANNGDAFGGDASGAFNSQGNNVVSKSDGSTGFTNGVNGDKVGMIASPLNALLGPLANNSGPTQTHALLPGSPALDAGNNALITNPPFAGPPFTDQRGTGFARIVDGPDADTTDTVDIGAFEAQVSVADIADQTINEDGSLTLPFIVGGAASITSVTATSSNTALVPNSPANISISGSGSSRTLQINPVAHASGTSTITLTVNGSNSQTMTDTFLLTVNPVNDAPSFTKGADQTVNENAGAQTVNNWATSISAGPTNESGQTVNFLVVSNSNASLFAVAPAVSSSGTLSYTPATGVSGTALITIALMDNGGTANGGVDTSASQSFNITVRDGGALQFSAATYAKAEDGGNAVITVTRTGGSAGEARVNYATSNGTATAGQDYTAGSGTLTFAEGVTSQSFNVAITNDAVFEGNETINLTLSNAAGTGSLGSPATAVLTITDDESIPGLSIDNTAVNEGNSGTANAIFTVTLSGQSSQTVTVNFASANDTATAGSDYQATSGTLTFLPLETSKPISVVVNGDINFEPNETFVVNLSNPVNATIDESPGGAQITNDDAQGGFISFSQSPYTVGESAGFTTITVNRTNDLSGPATVVYFTLDYTASATVAPCNTVSDFASSRCDYTTAAGTLQFAAGESSKTFRVLISQDSYEETAESLSLTLTQPTGGAVLGSQSTATLTITDDATEPPTNPVDSAEAFVRQHYHDFLNRVPDPDGLAFWTNQITECQQPGATCNAEVRRINVSAAFFLSIEFQETGYLVYRFYKSAYGNLSGAPVPLRFGSEFLPDTQQIGKGVVVGETGWAQQLEQNKVAFALDFVTRSRFTTAYPTTLTPAEFVDALFAKGGVTPSATERNAAISEFGGAGNTADPAARARALRLVAENSTLKQQETSKAFVLMQYFGYLRRNPNDPPEAGLNFDGYNFWLGKLNQFNGNYIEAELVKAFIDSVEYRQRFGP